MALLALVGCNPDYKLDEAARRIVVSPTLQDFGDVALGDEVVADVTLTSVSGGDVTVVSADLLDTGDDAFVVGAMPVVPGGGSATFPVTYHPHSDGWHLVQLTLQTDEETDNVHVVELRGHAGEASAQVWPSVLDFGPVAAGSSATRAVTVQNDGAIDLDLTDATIDGDVFSFDEALPQTLAAGDVLSLDVTFTPEDSAEASGSLSLDLGGASVPAVTLRGNACDTGDPELYDVDGDGFSVCATDCDDGDADAHPGAAETCDGVDQDCDGAVDEGTSCSDDDGDGATEEAGDCNDGDAGVGPGATEVMGNGIDDDCDGTVDDGTEDLDRDGYTAEAGDCDADAATVYPGAPELADGLDNDCDGITDEGTTAYDDDRDGWTEAAGDCDDSDATVSPGANESANWVDDDCDGEVDEGTDNGDDDGDGFTETGGDCDDARATVNPGAEETTGNGIDDDCDGVVE